MIYRVGGPDGPTDFSVDIADASKPAGREQEQSMFAGPIADCPDMYRRASPAAYVSSGGAPVFMLHGTNDATVDVRQTTVSQA